MRSVDEVFLLAAFGKLITDASGILLAIAGFSFDERDTPPNTFLQCFRAAWVGKITGLPAYS
jgi:hypothetical protein